MLFICLKPGLRVRVKSPGNIVCQGVYGNDILEVVSSDVKNDNIVLCLREWSKTYKAPIGKAFSARVRRKHHVKTIVRIRVFNNMSFFPGGRKWIVSWFMRYKIQSSLTD